MKIITYPFVPKSTASMLEGQIISLPLSNGKYACGRVLQFMESGQVGKSKSFVIGLLDWCGESPPNESSVSGCSSIIEHGNVHVKTLQECGAEITGFRNLSSDGISIPLSLNQMPGKNCGLKQGFLELGYASEQQQSQLKVFSTWGLVVFKILAEKHFGRV